MLEGCQTTLGRHNAAIWCRVVFCLLLFGSLVHGQDVASETDVIVQRLTSADLTRHIPYFHRYLYDDPSTPMYRIQSGGNVMYYGGNEVHYSAEGGTSLVAYNQTYSGTNYTFTTLAVHPFHAFFYINSSDEASFAIQVRSYLATYGEVTSDSFSGSVSSEDYVLTFEGNQVHDVFSASVCEVYFYIAKKNNDLSFKFSAPSQSYWNRQTGASLSGTPNDVIFGFVLLSAFDPGSQITQSQLEATMLDMLTTVTTGSGTVTTTTRPVTTDEGITRETQLILDRLKSWDVTCHLSDFQYYLYDDVTPPINKIHTGHYISFLNDNEDIVFADYNQTYNRSGYSFSTLAVHPFSAFFYINSTDQKERSYTIKVFSSQLWGLSWRSRSSTFSGSVSSGDHVLTFQGIQLFEGFTPSVCEIFYFVAKEESGLEFAVNAVPNYWTRNNEAFLYGNAKDAILGYTLLSTREPGGEITQKELEEIMLGMLNVITTGKDTANCNGELQQNVTALPEVDVILQRLSSSDLTHDISDFYFYDYHYNDSTSMYRIENGGDNMYEAGNYIYYIVNEKRVQAEYNKTYNGSHYSFITSARHPFTALYYINSTDESQETFEIEVISRIGNVEQNWNGIIESRLSGNVSDDEYELNFQGIQISEGFAPSVVEVFFYIAKSTSGLDFTFVDGRLWDWQDRRHRATLTGNPKNVYFGYILLSTILPGREITQAQLEATMSNMLSVLTTGVGTTSSSAPQQDPDVTEKTAAILMRLQSSSLLRHICDFHNYTYDDVTPPINSIISGGDDMFNRGNIIYFEADEETKLVEYDRTYNGSDYTFTALTIHPFIAMFYINSTNQTEKTFAIQVWSRFFNGRQRRTQSGSVSNDDYVLTFDVVQMFEEFQPSVVEVFFVITEKNQTETMLVVDDWNRNNQIRATLTGIPRNIVFAYMLLSTKSPGEEIMLSQLEATMLDVLVTITGGNVSLAESEEPIDQSVAQEAELLKQRLEPGNFTRHLHDYHQYTYDDNDSSSMNHINNGGENTLREGNYVFFIVDEKRILATYNETYLGSNYSFITLAGHPFLAFFHINSTQQTTRSYSIEVVSRLSSSSSSMKHGLVSYGDYTLTFEAYQEFSGFSASYCEVFFHVTKNQSGIQVSFSIPWTSWERRSKVTLNGFASADILGYVLLSTKTPGREITLPQLEAIMLDMLSTMISGQGTDSVEETTDPEVAQQTALISQRLESWDISGLFPDFNRYRYDDVTHLNNFMVNGGSGGTINGFDQANYIIFDVNGHSGLAEYNKTYSGPHSTFTTLAVHPFHAFLYVNSTNQTESSYSIEVLSRYISVYHQNELSGVVSIGDYMLSYQARQSYGGFQSSFIQVFYYISKNEIDFEANYPWYNWPRQNKQTLTGKAQDVILGYTLLSAQDPGRNISHEQLDRIMEDLLSIVTTGNSSRQNEEQYNQELAEKNGIIAERLESSDLTRWLPDFYEYFYDDVTQPINHIVSGGENMFTDGNYILFGANEETILAEYNKSYSASDYSFTTMAGHPFIAIMNINSSAQTNSSYSIQVWTEQISSYERNEFTGSVTSNGYVLSFHGVQFFYGYTPSVCEVYFYVTKAQLQLDISLSLISYGTWHRQSGIALNQNAHDVILGYTLLSTQKIGRQITTSQMEKTMLDLLTTIVVGNVTALDQPDPTLERKAEILSRSLQALDLTKHIERFYNYQYDDVTPPITNLMTGGRSMYHEGNFVYLCADDDKFLVEYNKTYSAANHVFTTFAGHPFTALLYINNSTDQIEKSFCIEVFSNVQSQYYWYGNGEQFSLPFNGSVSNDDHLMHYQGIQYIGRFDASVCEVYYYISKSSANIDFTFTYPPYYYGREGNKAVVSGDLRNVIMGYTLFSTFLPREIPNDELEAAMLELLEVLTCEDCDPKEETTSVDGYPGTNVILLAIIKKNETTATRTYFIQVTGGTETKSLTAFDVETFLITDLTPEVTYTVVVSVLNDGLLDTALTLTVATTKTCTLSCTNANCIAFNSTRTECVCKVGYEKHPNQTNVCLDIDECQLSSCPEDSTCSNSDGSFACRCPTGLQLFDGQCVEANICNQEPCENGGTCTTGNSSYSCSCPEHFFGPRCEYYTSPCLNVPCQNEGTCVDLSGSFRCDCISNYTGSVCDVDVDECHQGTFKCDPNSQCQNTIGDYKCNCNDGYRGDGRDKCYFIRLFAYGESVNDEVLTISDDVASPVLKASFDIPFGTKTFSNMRVTSNGLITLGLGSWFVQYLSRPWYNGFSFFDIGMIAPFWDNFHPSTNNNGRVYYQVYNKGEATLTEQSEAVVGEIATRINNRFDRQDFNPLFVLKATWNKVVMHDEFYHRDYPSTFQAIIASDGADTYLIYNYKEDAMMWDTRRRYPWGNRALIGYSFVLGQSFVEVQGDYRPDHRNQTGGGPTGQYFYHVAKRITNIQRAVATLECVSWYVRESSNPWAPDYEPCPCTSLQARRDPSFTWSVDVRLYWNARVNKYHPDYYRTASIEEWAYDEVGLYNCYQPRVNTGPRCCYSPRSNTFSPFWGWWSQSPLISGPLSSRYERSQIPIFERTSWWSWVSFRDEELFSAQFNSSMQNDLIPRRQCCVESQSQTLCDLYKALRPPANCTGYVPRRISFFWGDPHITTIDGVTYSFNGLGEYHMVYAPGVFSLQARTKKAKKEDMTDSDATVFVAFAAKDLASADSGTLQFEVDFDNENGDGVIVKVDGSVVNNITDSETIVSELSLTQENGTYTAVFPSSQSLTITASNYLLAMQFTGDTKSMQSISKGLLGYWDGDKQNDFEMRNGTTMNWESLQPTENLDILNGTLSERLLYPFGLSWKLHNASESFFSYSSDSMDTFENHNPVNGDAPPFLEDLVMDQRNSSHFAQVLSNCTTNGVVSTTCLYDVLTTNRSDIGENTKSEAESTEQISRANANSLPVLAVLASTNIQMMNGRYTLMAQINEITTFAVTADDADGHDVTFALQPEDSIQGVSINITSGVVTWTPTTDHRITSTTNRTLTVIGTDSLDGQTILPINVKLCVCQNGGTCLFGDPVLGSENYQIVDCECTDAWTGADCTEDRDGCRLSPCFSNVTCEDVPVPGAGEACGDCPEGTTGDGRNCTNIDMCSSNPCEHNCEPLYNAFTCSCNEGYVLVNTTQCQDVDECSLGNPCSAVHHTYCVNTPGDFNCLCNPGFDDSSGSCMNVDECSTGTHNCSLATTSCQDIPGSFACPCLPNYARNASESDETSCVDLDECIANLHTCDRQTEDCINESPLFKCICRSGFETVNGTCLDIKECSNPTLNTCNGNGSLCVEEEGSFHCECLAGYNMSEDGTCNDVDECADANICSTGMICSNFHGGYGCLCSAGFSINAAGTCSDNDECTDQSICPQGSSCFNLDGGYECRCQVGVECTINPQLDQATLLQVTTDSITVTVDALDLYDQYELQAVDSDGTVTTNTSTGTFASITGLKPNTNYTIRARVLKLKTSDHIYEESNFSEPLIVTTNAIDLALVVTLVGEVYSQDLTDISSTQSQSLRNVYENALREQLKSVVGGVTLRFKAITFIAFRSGSVVASAVGALDTNDPSHRTAVADGTDLDAATFRDFSPIRTIPSSPSNLQVTDATTRSLTFGFEQVSNSISYEVKLTCPSQSFTETVSTFQATLTGLTPDTICSGEVRALVDVGSNAVAFTPYSNPVVTSTTPEIAQIVVSSITETSLSISFAAVSRAVTYRVSVAGVTLVQVSASTSTSGSVVNIPVTGLEQGTEYVFTITAGTTDAAGMQRNAIAEVTATTNDLNECLTVVCQPHATCNNTVGSYSCVCNGGFVSDSAGSSCLDIDECSASHICPSLSTCMNTPGSYLCDCNSGYALDVAGESCEDIDECALATTTSVCPNHSTCTNAVGSFTCTCVNGYTYDSATSTCLGPCEVQTSYCANGATCRNQEGGGNPVCLCAAGYVGDRCEGTDGSNDVWKIVVGVCGGIIFLVVAVVVVYKMCGSGRSSVYADI